MLLVLKNIKIGGGGSIKRSKNERKIKCGNSHTPHLQSK